MDKTKILPNEYKIEITMEPHTWDNRLEPYFWCIFGYYEYSDSAGYTNGWCNEGCGWSKTPEKAWKDALKYYSNKKK
jgi:hypothetical protein